MVSGHILSIILGMAAVTYLTRGPVLAVAGRLRMPPFVQACLEVAPVAAMATLAVSFVVYPGGEFAGVTSNPAVYAGIVSAIVAYRWRSIALTAVIGVGALNLFERVIL